MLDFKLNVYDDADPKQLYDVIIIGGGPAGMTAGLYLARYKLKTLMIEKQSLTGGQLTVTEWVENYPGFPEPILGEKLAKNMETQAKSYGLEIINETVTKAELKGKIKKIHTPYNVLKARTILITTGSSPRKLEVPGETEFYGKGVSYCATCDGPLYPDKVLAVVGGGNSAFEESLFLSKYASKLYLIHHNDRYRADKIYREKVSQNPKIQLMPFHKLEKIDFLKAKGKKLQLRNVKTDKETSLPVDAIFIFIGNIPNSEMFKNTLQLQDGYIVTDNNHQTGVEGVWAAGDIEVKAFRQVANAVGDGAEAAYWINKYLSERT